MRAAVQPRQKIGNLQKNIHPLRKQNTTPRATNIQPSPAVNHILLQIEPDLQVPQEDTRNRAETIEVQGNEEQA